MRESAYSHRVLVVDNEPLVVEELVEFLARKGYSCIGCTSPEEAVETFVSNTDVDIVLSDFRMPSMNGVELLKTLGVAGGSGRIFETIIFTGNAEKDDVIDALRIGVSDYFEKPVDFKLLLEGLERMIKKLEKRKAESRIRMLSHNLNAISSTLSDICSGIDPAVVSEQARPGHSSQPQAPSVSDANLLRLSRRQREVASLVVKGLTNYQIACDLGISENTTKLYVSQVLRMFNLNNRTQLARVLGNSINENFA